ncbi:MAG: ATPase [Sphingobacteriales bacterium 12-47-4]|nr:MAG: ATPase [Sphingobacteriales bacterium 12-47-4]
MGEKNTIKKIVIIGPESTGKSTLCRLLAAHFNKLWYPEYAREYLLKHGTSYTYDDLLTIAKGQVALEEEYVLRVEGRESEVQSPGSGPLLFLDTNMYVMQVWCEFVFDKCHKYILEQIALRKYDLYLLCATDLPWVKDELREYPDLESRERLYKMYKDLLVNQETPWVEIRGTESDRFRSALSALSDMAVGV